MEKDLIPVAKLGDLSSGGVIGAEVRGEKIAVFQIGKNYYALDALCPHEGGPLERGRLEGESVICPWHLWKFNIRTGVLEGDSTICVRRYKVQVKNDDICVDFTEVHEAEKKWEEILYKLDSGEDPIRLSTDYSVPMEKIRDAVRRRRVGERLIWLGKLYQEQGFIGPIDLLRMPKRNEKGLTYAVIPLIDELTANL